MTILWDVNLLHLNEYLKENEGDESGMERIPDTAVNNEKTR